MKLNVSLFSELSRYKLLDREDVLQCKELLLDVFKESFPEYYREVFLVSPDCIADHPTNTSTNESIPIPTYGIVDNENKNPNMISSK
eukprot:CAMPEP_0204842244 /NCGR_PEP_ID=MMETSP1346-20131115/45444_1 /ASSEMBLY_ACC=CAM_ASM_000771 /TAXON_ID=215587 /ORGANISM="Aplanochytrium stocchinoi, Strain GSBS06" /LENGTH=86 /DNA_ID=CAMNT_0051980901 /DNA_START=340 /DNA_END=600 /DNA_ORIENTATION=+